MKDKPTDGFRCESAYTIKFIKKNDELVGYSTGIMDFTLYAPKSGYILYVGDIYKKTDSTLQKYKVNRTLEFNRFYNGFGVITETTHVNENSNDNANTQDVIKFVSDSFAVGKRKYTSVTQLSETTYVAGEGPYIKAICQIKS